MKKSTLIRGTVILSLCGITCRILGFFFRIFLSKCIGPEQMGLYQLLFPVLSVGYALCTGAYQTAISKLTAAKMGRSTFFCGCFLSLSSALILSFLLITQNEFIADTILLEKRLCPLIYWLGFLIPFSAVNACFAGYYLGKGNYTKIGALQVLEQLIRIFYVILLYYLVSKKDPQKGISAMTLVMSMLVSEMCICFCYLLYSTNKNTSLSFSKRELKPLCKNILSIVIPLSTTRLMLNILQGAKTTLLPGRLKLFGLSAKEALSCLGSINGLVMPFLLFPGTLTNAMNLLLVPELSKNTINKQRNKLSNIVGRCCTLSTVLGIFFFFIYYYFGDFISENILSLPDAKRYFKTLSFLCPFLYVSGTLNSVLIGLGSYKKVFQNQMISSLLSFFCILILIPCFGIDGYLFSLILEQGVLVILQGNTVIHLFSHSSPSDQDDTVLPDIHSN